MVGLSADEIRTISCRIGMDDLTKPGRDGQSGLWYRSSISIDTGEDQEAYQEEPVITINTIDLIQEERSVHVGDRGIQVL